jgi:putative exporter of polyketide antibiotics
MGTITKPNTFSANTTIQSAQVNSNFDTIYSEFNGSISSANTDSTIATVTGTETLTNKTLTKPTINGSIGAYTSNSDGATVTFNMASSNTHTVTLGGNRILAVSNTSVGQRFIVRLVQDGTGSRTVTWFSTISWPGGSAPTLSTGASAIDTFGFICTAADTYDGYIIGLNLS